MYFIYHMYIIRLIAIEGISVISTIPEIVLNYIIQISKL